MIARKEIVNQLIVKSKEFCYTFYVMLDKLGTELQTNENTEKHILSPSNYTCIAQETHPAQECVEAKKIQAAPHATIEKLESSHKTENDNAQCNKTERETIAKVVHPNESKKAAKPTRYNGYLLFYKSISAEVKKEYPHYGFTDMAKIISQKWKSLPYSEQHNWNVKSNPDKYNGIKKRIRKSRRKIPIEISDKKITNPVEASNKKSTECLMLARDKESLQKMIKIEELESNNIDYDTILNERAELKRRLLEANSNYAKEERPSNSFIKVLPGGSGSSLF